MARTVVDNTADDRLRQREESLPLSPRYRSDGTAAPALEPRAKRRRRRRRRICIRRWKTWIKGTCEVVPDLVKMLRRILVD